MPKVYVGDIGTKITVLTKTNLALADTAMVKVKITNNDDPRNPTITYKDWPATVKGAPKEGVIEHIATGGDFAVAGTYAIQAHVTFQDGGEFTGETAILTVYDVFE